MTIASATSRISYTGDGTTTAFAVPFFFSANSDLVVSFQDLSGNITTKTLGIDYNLTGVTVPAGGTCTFAIAPTTGFIVVIYRVPPITQTTSYNNNDPFPAKSHEAALDKAATISQYLKTLLDRAILVAPTDTPPMATLPPASVRALKTLSFDAAGNPSATTPIAAGTTVSSALIPVVTAATLPLARTALGLDIKLPVQSANVSGGAAGKATVTAPYLSKMNTFTDLLDYGVVYDWDQVANTGTDNTTAVQNAISDNRGLLRVSGKVLVNDVLSIPGDMIVQGNGRATTGFVFKAGYSAAKNGLVITSGGTNAYEGGGRGRGLYNFGIFAQSGTIGNVPIVMDLTDGRFLCNYTIEKIMVRDLWSSSKSFLLSTAGQADGFFTSLITDCFFNGGLDLTNAGDSIKVTNNTITGGGFHAVFYKPVSGAAQFLGMGNNCTTAGGAFTAFNADQAKWIYNQCEQVATYSGTFNAVITLDGTANSEVIGNNVNARDFCDCVLITTSSVENLVDLNALMCQTATPRYHLKVASSATNELGERNRYFNWNSASPAGARSATYTKGVNDHTRGLQSGPLALTGGWSAGGDSTFLQGLFSTRYGRQVHLDGQITGGTLTAATVIAQLPADHWPTLVRRVPVIVDNAGAWSMGVVNINTVGQVAITVAFAGNTLVHFDGTSFEI